MNLPNSRFSITREQAEDLIVKEKTIHDSELAITIVMAVLKNGHRLTTNSTVADDGIFDQAKGYEIAKRRLIAEIIRYETYSLKTVSVIEEF